MSGCRQCGGELSPAFRFCPWCAAPQRSKLVEFFRAHPLVEGAAALRVSRYVGSTEGERHVRFSVWNTSGVAEAAVSLDDGEAERLGWFLLQTGGKYRDRHARSVVKDALATLRRGSRTLERFRELG